MPVTPSGENKALATRLMANLVAYNKPLASAVADGLMGAASTAATPRKDVNAVGEATGTLTAALQATGLFFGANELTKTPSSCGIATRYGTLTTWTTACKIGDLNSYIY